MPQDKVFLLHWIEKLADLHYFTAEFMRTSDSLLALIKTSVKHLKKKHSFSAS